MLLLDCAGIAAKAGLHFARQTMADHDAIGGVADERPHLSALLFRELDGKRRAVPLDIIDRVELASSQAVRVSAGQLRLSVDDGIVSAIGELSAFASLSQAVEAAGIVPTKSSLERLPTQPVELTEEQMEEVEALLDKNKRVAVKLLRASASDHDKKCFLEEAMILGRLKHSNIIKVHGICLDARPYMLILEYMAGGDLKHYLRKHRNEFQTRALLQMDLDVARACCYMM